ncbi:recombinase family protein [Streptomyces sp. NPDC047049]|uniref:recombinase family protein n=1 Tax=Streptomyces sp. NPDC047049 TaxID=3156688 RepID=UPI0033FE7E88
MAQGRIAYGWVRKGEHKGQLLPDETDVVVRIFQDFMSGESAYSIAKAFNAEGIKPPAASTWSSTMIARMLRNPRYASMSPAPASTDYKLPRLGTAGPWFSSTTRGARCWERGSPSSLPSSGRCPPAAPGGTRRGRRTDRRRRGRPPGRRPPRDTRTP